MRRYGSPCSEYPTTCVQTGSPVRRVNITFVPSVRMVVFHFSESEQNVLPRVQGIQVAVPQNHSHPHSNTVSRNKNFCVDQVTVPQTPWGRTRGGAGQGGTESLLLSLVSGATRHPECGFAAWANGPHPKGVRACNDATWTANIIQLG